MKRKFSELLSSYLDEYSKLNSDYYENRCISDKYTGYDYLNDLAKEMDDMIDKVDNAGTPERLDNRDKTIHITSK